MPSERNTLRDSSKYSIDKISSFLKQEGLIDADVSTVNERISIAIQIPKVREMFDINTPQITDLTNILNIKNNDGKVFAIRMDLNKHVDNHKKLVVASLILRNILLGKLPNSKITTLIDGGNFNSAYALRFYCDRFGLKGAYVMSKLFPDDVLEMLRTSNFSIIQAPDKYGSQHREVEFYEYLFTLMKNQEFRSDKICLWHAKYGGDVTGWIGNEITNTVSQKPDVLVSCLGAGSTLEGIQIPIKHRLHSNIIIAEHEKSPLFAKILKQIPHSEHESKTSADGFRKYDGLPHSVIGPHVDEINPLLSKDAIAEIDGVITFSESEWKEMSILLQDNNIPVGNSSAANVACAKELAESGKNVLTIIFEPLRKFYVK